MRLLLTGANGQLGNYLLRACREKECALTAWSGHWRGERFGYPVHPVDLTDSDAVAQSFVEARPEAILHVAALAGVADCRRDPARAERINVHGSALLAELAHCAHVPMIHVSTDMVFDGEQAPYREEDVVAPLSIYGRSKVAAERAVRAYPRNSVVRVALLFGPSLSDSPAFFDQQIAALRQGRRLTLFDDEWRTPLSLRTAARALLTLAEADPVGLLHLGGPERMSRLEMGQRLAVYLGCDEPNIVSLSRTNVADAEPRPRDLSLDSSKWRTLFPRLPWPTWEEALKQLLRGDEHGE